VAEGARLESVYTATYRGFESLPHRQIKKAPKLGAFLCVKISPCPCLLVMAQAWALGRDDTSPYQRSELMFSFGISTSAHLAKSTAQSAVISTMV
jgi:sulfite exporter TauE/SafE